MPINAVASDLPALPEDMNEKDILEAMRRLDGYLDISPADALALYRLAFAHAAARLGRDAPVREIMTRNPVRAAPDTTALAAARIMAAAGVSGLPVLDGQTVVGVLSAKDLLRLLALPAESSAAALLARLLSPDACSDPLAAPTLGETPVSSLMTSPAVVVGPDTLRSQAAGIMAQRGINRLPVVDAAGLCGIVSRGDVVRSCRGGSCGGPA